MDKKEFTIFFLEECQKNKIIVAEEKISLFYEYMQAVLKWNEKVNVTAIKDEKEFVKKHFMDSLSIGKYIKQNNKVIDIGTGAGFPGIPLKILKDDIAITLIDSINKKINMIKDITDKMILQDVELIHTRAETLAMQEAYREKFDVATTRAVSNLSTILEYMLPFVKIGGKAICMKGPNYKKELEQGEKAISILGGKIEEIQTILVSNEIERNNIIIKKIKKTPLNYPRGQGKPLKDPIK